MAIPRWRRTVAPLGALITLAVAATAVASSSPPAGSVHQPSGKAGCYTDDGASEAGPGTCHTIRGGGGATTLAISPDGRFAYVVGYGSSTSSTPVPVLAVLRRNTTTGTLRQLSGKPGCFSQDGSSEAGLNTCARARDLGTGDATSIVISNDGRFLYVASQNESAGHRIGGIAVFARNVKTGELRQLKGSAGCVTAVAYDNCAVAREVDEVSNVHITPDQKYLYASDYLGSTSGIAIFARSAKHGTLRQLTGVNGCLSVDGTTYQSGTTKVCRAMPNISSPWDVATPDNRFAYVPAGNGPAGPNLVQAFERNAKGGLVPLAGKGGCVSDTGTSPAGPCTKGHGLTSPERAVPSPNGHFLYIGSYSSPSPIVVLNRNPKTGSLSERAGPAACISADGTTGDGIGSCRTGKEIIGEYAGAVSPDGRTLYFSEYSTSQTAGGLAILRLSPTTGAFSQLRPPFGCVTGANEKGPGTCQSARAVAGAYQVAIDPSGKDVYVSSYNYNGVALLYANK